MAITLTDTQLLIGGHDLVSTTNEVEVELEVGTEEATVFGSGGWTEKLPGLKSAGISAAGFADYDAAGLDAELWAALGTERIVTVAPLGAVVGAVAYSLKATTTSLSHFGKVGEISPFALEGTSTRGAIARGVVAHPSGADRSASGFGTAVLVGAVPEGRKLAATLHVLRLDGTDAELAVTVETDSSGAMATPVDAITFDPATDIGAQFKTLAGPVTDTHARVSWVITGTDVAAEFVVTVGLV